MNLIIPMLLLGAGLLLNPLSSLADPLQTAPVQVREVKQSHTVDGVIEAARQTTVSAQISGRVKEIAFDIGDIVKPSQVILRIDEREAVQGQASARAQVMQSQATLANAKANFDRSRQLFEQKFISQAALDKAQADYKLAVAQAAASEAGASQSALIRGYSAVIAPYGGVVAARMVEVGELVTVGKPLMTGFDPSQLRAVVHVPEQVMHDLEAQPEVQLELPAVHRWVRAASITVQPMADARTHSTQVRVMLPANEPGIYPGMFVRAHFVTGKTSKMLIPASAVLRRSEVIAVYVVDDKGGIRLRQVRLGEATGQDEVEVMAGLNPGEKVALDPIKAGMGLQQKNRLN